MPGDGDSGKRMVGAERNNGMMLREKGLAEEL